MVGLGFEKENVNQNALNDDMSNWIGSISFGGEVKGETVVNA
jgi:hypothetical protein